MPENAIAWGTPETVEAPYWMLFSCHAYSKFYQDRAPLDSIIAEVLLPGTIVSRGTMNRYNDDAPLAQGFESLQNALASKDRYSGDDLQQDLIADLATQAYSDTFGNMQRSMGRVDLVTTETVYMGASRRKYQLNWNLKTVADEANSELAALIGNQFESLSMPSPLLNSGNIVDAISRMDHPPLWQLSAWDARNNSNQTGFWLGQPKPCALVEVAHGIDTSRFYRTDAAFYPFSYNIGLTFVEVEGVFRDPSVSGGIMSRSELFNRI